MRIDCFDKIKHKEVKQLQQAFNDLVPEDTDLSEQEQKEIGKKIALDYFKQVNQELTDLKKNILKPSIEELILKEKNANDIGDESMSSNYTQADSEQDFANQWAKKYYNKNYYSDLEGEEKKQADKEIKENFKGEGYYNEEMDDFVGTYEDAIRSFWENNGPDIKKLPTEKIEQIEQEAEKEIKKVDPKIPVSKLPIKAKVAQRKVRDEKLAADIKAKLHALKNLNKGGATFTSGGIDPEKLERATEIIGMYIKAGVYKLSDIIEDAYAELGEEIKGLFELLKTAYGGYYMSQADQVEADQMDLSERKLTFDDITSDMVSEAEAVENFEKVEKSEPRRQFIDTVKERIEKQEKQNIVSLRKLATELGIDVVDTNLQEMVEMAVVELSRDMANKSWQEKYILEGIIDIYDNQPTISMRSANRIELQQYSTPAPTAYIAGLYVAAGKPGSVFEPSAGNGMMTIAFKPGIVTVNEIDPVRLDNLAGQGFMQVTNRDALQPFQSGKRYEGLVMNPPFGSSEQIEVNGYKIAGLAQKMAINALTNLKPNGRAAIIIGGHNEYDDKGRITSERTFFNWLYNQYNVAAVINISGELYAKQGTSFPTRLILIHSKKAIAEGATPILKSSFKPFDFWSLPGHGDQFILANGKEVTITQVKGATKLHYALDDMPITDTALIKFLNDNKAVNVESATENKVVTSFYELLKIVNDLKNITYENILQPGMDANRNDGDAIHGKGADQLQPDNEGRLPAIPPGQVRPNSSGRPSAKGNAGLNNGDTGSTNTDQSDTNGTGDNDNGIGPVSDLETDVPFQQPGTGDNRGTGIGNISGNQSLQSARKFESGELSSNAKVPYVPKSSSQSVDTVIPSRMATDAENILTKINNEYGGIDNFVQKKLGYATKEELFNALSGEQVDAVAMTIVQIENGQGMIIGDMTGVGKGRIAAAVLRYGINQGLKPIFLTETPGLFSDLYRDLVDIDPTANKSWSKNVKPFIVNDKNSSGDPTITDKDGNVVHKLMPAATKKGIFANKQIPKDANFVLATYSQFGTSSDKPSAKKDFFAAISEGNILILDESHNVAGQSNRGEFFKEAIASSKGVLYLSATFAKTPQAMPVYAMKTAMQEANMSNDELVRAIEHGGVALQEVVAAQLVESGQMLRRERSFDGVSVDYEVLEETGEAHREIADKVTDIIRDIIDFQAIHVAEVIQAMDDIAAAAGARMTERGGTNMAGVNNQPFASKVFNLIDQLLFSIKALDIADAAIEELKANRKPVIGFKSTMGSFLDHIGAQPGERLEKIDFSLTLKRALEGVMRYTEKDAQGNSIPGTISLADLTEDGRAEYQRILDKIIKASSGITISPIDVMIKRIQDAGYTVKEITGRKIMLDIQDDGSAIVTTRFETDKKKIVREFNEGELDVVMLNMSGATGISMHASSKFKDQRQRVMIDGQMELDINKAVQKRGRIDRVGQVVRGAYRYIVSAIQAESRLLMMFKKKLKSLDANTTSSQKSIKTADVVDFLNKYGDEIVTEYLKENRELNDKLLDPLKFNDKSDEDLDGINKIENAALKVTGRVAFLHSKDQNEFYKEVSDRYTDYIEYLESNNSNDLEVKVLPLNAKTLTSDVIVEGKGGDSPFGNPSILEQIETDVLKKPLKKVDIDKEVIEGLDGLTPEQKSTEVLDGIESHYDGVIEQGIAKLELQHEKNKISVAKNAREKAEKEGLDFQAIEDAVEGSLERLEFAKNEAIKRLETRNNFVKNNLSRLARYFKIGNLYEVPVSVRTDTTIGTSKGIFLGFNIKKNRKNPYAPSAINMRFAVNDSRRIVSIPLSKQDFINAVIANSSFMTPQARQNFIDNWDSLQSTRTREHRFMVTGNLLQAFGTNDGQLVSYTDDQGNLLKGILLPESYRVQEQKRRIPINQAASYLEKRGSFITTIDRDVVIKKESTGYTITVPLTKKAGGKYFLNKGLQALVNERGFNQMAGKMTAYFSDSKLQDILDFLYREYNSSIEVDSKINKAELRKEEKAEPEPDVVEEDKDEDFVEVLVQRAKDEFPNVPEAFFGPYRNLLATELLPNLPLGSIHRHLLKRMSQFQVNTPETQAMHDVIELASRMIDAKEDDSNDMFLHDDKELGDHFLINAWGETAKVSLQDKRSYRDFGDQDDKELGAYFEMPLEFATGVNQEAIFNSYLFFRDAYNFFSKSNPDFSVSEPVSEEVQDLIDVIQEEVDNGLLSLTALQDKIAKELEDDSQELRDQVAEAYNEYTKRFTPDEINQAINKRLSDNLSAAFGGKDKVQVVNDEDIIPLVNQLGDVTFNATPEQQATQELLDNAKAEYQTAKKAFEAKRKALDKAIGADQADLFGERPKAPAPGLFDERVSQSGRDKAMEPFKARMVKAEKEINRLQKKLDGLGNQSAQATLFNIGGKLVKPVDIDVVNGFYSPLEKTINEFKGDKLPAKQWAEKFKGEEAKWTGLIDWLNSQTGSVSKADILKFLKENRIEVVEIVKGGSISGKTKAEKLEDIRNKIRSLGYDLSRDMSGDWYVQNKEGEDIYDEDEYEKLPSDVKELAQQHYDISEEDEDFNDGDVKYSGYQLPGEKTNYKEVLITMPPKEIKGEPYHIVRDKYLNPVLKKLGLDERAEYALRRMKSYNDDGRSEEFKNDKDYPTAIKALTALKEGGFNDVVDKYYSGFEFNKKVEQQRKNTFKSSHWNEPNILAHVRMNTRVDAEGKKVLFLEEIQSDWGEIGRKQGFNKTAEEVQALWNAADKNVDEINKKLNAKYGADWDMRGDMQDILTTKEVEEYKTAATERAKWGLALGKGSNTGTPNAPFVTDTNAWTKLALKVAVKEAVKQGADKIAWTTGEQQADRYDLSKQIDRIESSLNKFGNYDLRVFPKGSGNGQIYADIPANKLSDYVGKELAERIVAENKTVDKTKYYAELDLKVGGEGMTGFYGNPSKNNLGIVGNVAKSLFKQEPKTIQVKTKDSIGYNDYKERGVPLSKDEAMNFDFNGNSILYAIEEGQLPELVYNKPQVKNTSPYANFIKVNENFETQQHSVDITPEMKAQVEAGQPLFMKSPDGKILGFTHKTKMTTEQLLDRLIEKGIIKKEC